MQAVRGSAVTSPWLVVAALAAAGATAGRVHATTFVAMSERALARAADAIVVGTVTGLETVGDEAGGIYTLVTIRVESRHKGGVGGEIVLKQPGGELAERGLVIPGSPVFSRGERNLLFLSAAYDGTARTTALGLGQYRLDAGDGGAPVAERALHEPVLRGPRVRRVKLARLLRAIDKAVRTDTRTPRPLAAVPAEATAPGLERATVAPFTLMDVPSARWHEADLGVAVAYGVDPAGDPALGPATSFAAVDAAFAAWSAIDGASIVVVRGEPAELAPLICDGRSQIVFGDPFNEMPKPHACSGVLALGGYCTKGRALSESDVVNGVRFRRIAEGNITFNTGFGGCPFWNEANLAEVAAHEVGHTIGIGHASQDDDESQPALKDATMYYRAHFDGRGASLRADDIAAARHLYPGPADVSPTTDADADGVADADDNCPGDDPELGLANGGQTDTDGDGVGDLCDPCPLDAGTTGCQPLWESSLRVRDVAGTGEVTWRGELALPPDADVSRLRIVFATGPGVLVDTANPASGLRRTRGSRRLLYRSDQARIALKRGRHGLHAVRAVLRAVPLGADAMPVVRANLAVGGSTYVTSLSCGPRGARRFTCRG
jgi:hypothetical protein